MNTSIFGPQSPLVWIWAGCGIITLADYTIVEINFGIFGAIAAWGFALPILLLILYVATVLFGL